MTDSAEDAISPVIAIVLIISLTVITIITATGIIFDAGTIQGSQGDVGSAAISVDKNLNGEVTILVKKLSAEKVLVKLNESTYNLSKTGDFVTLNPSSDSTILVNTWSDGDEQLLRRITLDSSFVSRESTEESVTYLTWNSASEWNNSVSESGVAHESVQYTDHDNASNLKEGYSVSNPYKESSLVGYWTLDENTGSTAYELAGTFPNGSTIGGPRLDQPGLSKTTAWNFDGNDDGVNIGDVDYFASNNEDITISCWYKLDNYTNTDNSCVSKMGSNGDDNYALAGSPSKKAAYFRIDSGSGNVNLYTGTLSLNTWYHIVAVYNSSSGAMRLYVNGTQVNSTTTSTGGVVSNNNKVKFASNDYSGWLNGSIGNVHMYDSPFSDSDVRTLYNVVSKNSTLTTGTKSFGNPTQPDLSNLKYSLNGESVEITVIGSPGTASEEKNTVTLDGSSSYDLTWGNNHTDFRVKITFVESKISTSPIVKRIGLKSQ